ncbi:lecithin retinol acyltransferase family protein [Aeromonas taiwanensis]
MSRFTPGDHLVTARLGYTHHGLYVGSDLVIHYQGPNLGLPGEIVMTSLGEFSDGKPIWCKFCPVRQYDRAASIERAHTRLGEHRYDVLFSNCEHFVMWCIHGLHHSLRIPVKLNSDSGICEHHFRKVCGQGFFEQKLSFEGRHLFDSLNKPAAKRSAAVVDPRRWNRTVHLTSEYVH